MTWISGLPRLEEDGIKCQGCKRQFSEVDPGTSRRLRGLDGEWYVPRAFECVRCEVIIFEDEFDEGMFVPPVYRAESTRGASGRVMLVTNPPGPFPFTVNS